MVAEGNASMLLQTVITLVWFSEDLLFSNLAITTSCKTTLFWRLVGNGGGSSSTPREMNVHYASHSKTGKFADLWTWDWECAFKEPTSGLEILDCRRGRYLFCFKEAEHESKGKFVCLREITFNRTPSTPSASTASFWRAYQDLHGPLWEGSCQRQFIEFTGMHCPVEALK